MNLQKCNQQIASLNYLIKTKIPEWNSPILAMIPAPKNSGFSRYLEALLTQDSQTVNSMGDSEEFEILLIFTNPESGFLVYEWYSYFFDDKGEVLERWRK